MQGNVVLVEELGNNKIAAFTGNIELLSFLSEEGNVLVNEKKKYKVSKTEYSFDENAFIVYVNAIS